MSSVYARTDSPYYWARFPGKKPFKTPFRKDQASGKRHAMVWVGDQAKLAGETRRSARHEHWEEWVPTWLKVTITNPKTAQRYGSAWVALYQYLTENKLRTPREMAYRHAGEYMAWRTQQKRRRGTTINHNTAILELKVLSRIMREAHRREYCAANPFYQMGLKRQNVKHAPEMSDAEIQKVLEKLPEYILERPHCSWMLPCFRIAIYHGVRLSETSVPMERVDLARGTISFDCKGGKINTVPIHPELLPMLRETKGTHTCVLPRMAAKEWWNFRQRYGLEHTTFHSTRTVVASKMARANVPIQKAKAYLAHASETIHLAYLRLNAHDLEDVASSISFATPPQQ
jgi:integrase